MNLERIALAQLASVSGVLGSEIGPSEMSWFKAFAIRRVLHLLSTG